MPLSPLGTHLPTQKKKSDLSKKLPFTMPTFNWSIGKYDKFTPNKATLENIYCHSTGLKELSDSMKVKIYNVLKKDGYSKSQLSNIVHNGKEIPIKEMRKVAQSLHKYNIYGFNEPSKYTVNKYLIKERTKKHNIAIMIRERHLEDVDKDINSLGKQPSRRAGDGSRGPKKIKLPF